MRPPIGLDIPDFDMTTAFDCAALGLMFTHLRLRDKRVSTTGAAVSTYSLSMNPHVRLVTTPPGASNGAPARDGPLPLSTLPRWACTRAEQYVSGRITAGRVAQESADVSLASSPTWHPVFV